MPEVADMPQVADVVLLCEAGEPNGSPARLPASRRLLHAGHQKQVI